MKTFRLMISALFPVLLVAGCAGAGVAAPETAGPRVALVFDDGPDLEVGGRLRTLLEQEGVSVTFAQVGRNVERHPELTRAAAAAGHEIVNHSYSHAGIGKMDAEQVAAEVVGGRDAIAAALGEPPRWYWPPYLAVNERLVAALEQHQQTLFVPHNLVSSDDYNREIGPSEILRKATQRVRDGTVILFHEWRSETVDQLPAILAELRRQGCRFYTFSGLASELQAQPPTQGANPQTQKQFSAHK